MMPLLITALFLLAGVIAAFVIYVITERRRTDEAAEVVRRMADGDLPRKAERDTDCPTADCSMRSRSFLP